MEAVVQLLTRDDIGSGTSRNVMGIIIFAAFALARR
jgi:hypothetical protein